MSILQKKGIDLSPDISVQLISVLLPVTLPPSGGLELAELGPSGRLGSNSAPWPAPSGLHLAPPTPRI